MSTNTAMKKSLTEQASGLVDQVTPYVEAARDRIVEDYLPAAQSMLADATVTAKEVALEARDAAQEAAVRAEKSTRKSRRRAAKKARAKARELVDTAVAAAPENTPLVSKAQRKPRRKRTMLALLVVAGVGAILVKRLRGQSPAATSYTPPRPVPEPRPASQPTSTMPPETSFDDDSTTDTLVAGAGGSVDAGGAFLDDAVADAEEQPHEVTTPDEPLEVQDVSGAKSRKA